MAAPALDQRLSLTPPEAAPFLESTLPLFTDRQKPAEIDQFDPVERISTLFYIRPEPLLQVEKPYFMNVPVKNIEGLAQSNVSYTRKKVSFTSIRGHESLFSLDRQGFEVGTLETTLHYHDFDDPAAISTTYFAEVRRFLMERTGCSHVITWDYQVRRRDPELPTNSRGAPGKAQPFGAVHADQTIDSAVRRLKYFHPKEAAKYDGHRTQIVNVWKPLRGPVYDAPLAVCDYQSLEFEDRVPTDIIFPDYLGETYHIWPNPKHRWYFVDGQQSNEALIVKCFDSKTSEDPEIAQFTPHASFPYPQAPPDALLRESIEVRTFLFYD